MADIYGEGAIVLLATVGKPWGQSFLPAAPPMSGPCQPEIFRILCTYGPTGNEQTIAVPAAGEVLPGVPVDRLEISARGARGGNVDYLTPVGGTASVVSASLPLGGTAGVKPGTTLYVEVGGDGQKAYLQPVQAVCPPTARAEPEGGTAARREVTAPISPEAGAVAARPTSARVPAPTRRHPRHGWSWPPAVAAPDVWRTGGPEARTESPTEAPALVTPGRRRPAERVVVTATQDVSVLGGSAAPTASTTSAAEAAAAASTVVVAAVTAVEGVAAPTSLPGAPRLSSPMTSVTRPS